MGSRGAIIMSSFGAVFLASTFAWNWHVSGPALILPFLVSVAIAVAAVYVLRQPGSGNVLSARAKRTLVWASTGEGIGIFVAINIVTNLHRPEWRLPAMVLVVGLHFLPIAYGAGFRVFYALAAALIAISLISFALPMPFGGELAGVGAATCLWIASVIAVQCHWKLIRTATLPV